MTNYFSQGCAVGVASSFVDRRQAPAGSVENSKA